MTHSVPRELVEGFYQALESRDLDTVGRFLDDDVVWTISGPVDLLPFCGQRSGKDVVMKLIKRDIPNILTGRRFVTNAMLVDGDRVAALGKLTATKSADGHAVSYRIAQFIRFRAGKVVEYVSIIDSFDAVEQVLGHSIGVLDASNLARSDVIAI